MQPPATISVPPRPAAAPVYWLLSAAVAVLLCVSFRTPLAWMVERWMQADSYYSHGPLVPLVALWFVWNDRRALLSLAPERSLLGLACMGAGLLILLASGLLSIYFTAGFGLILTLWGLCGFLLGRAAMRRLAFPMFVLLFMVPPPLEIIDNFSLWLKLRVTDMTLGLLTLIGIVSVNDGATIYLGSAVVTVGNACSGLRSLISLIFLGVLFTGVSDLGWLRRTALFAASFPIAIVSNVVRVFILCLIAWRWGGPSIMAPHGIGRMQASLHDVSGYLIFIVAFALLYGVLAFLSRWRMKGRLLPSAERAAANPPESAVESKPAPASKRGNGLMLRFGVVLALLCATAMASARALFPAGFENSHLRTPATPMIVGDWAGQDVRIDDDVKAILETADVIQRNYYNPKYGGVSVQLAVVFSPSNRRVAHPPEICYTAAGWEMMSKSIHDFEGMPPVVRMTLNHARRENLVLYTFKAGDEFTANYYRHQYNIMRNMLTMRATSSALVRLSTAVSEAESESQAETRLLDFSRKIMPILSKELN